jgi:hypothetical protein
MTRSKHPGLPVSLVCPQAATATERRAIAGLKTSNEDDPNSVDSPGTFGFFAQGKRFLHIMIDLPDSGTSITWSLWTYDSVSELWGLDTRLGTDGVVTLSASDADNPQRSIIEIDGLDRVYLQVTTTGGVFTEGVDAWLATSGIVDAS